MGGKQRDDVNGCTAIQSRNELSRLSVLIYWSLTFPMVDKDLKWCVLLSLSSPYSTGSRLDQFFFWIYLNTLLVFYLSSYLLHSIFQYLTPDNFSSLAPITLLHLTHCEAHQGEV